MTDKIRTKSPKVIYLELSDDYSDKFWEVAIDGKVLILRWGKIGTTGQSKTKTFDSLDEAASNAEKLKQAKINKGYSPADPTQSDKTPIKRPGVKRNKVLDCIEQVGDEVIQEVSTVLLNYLNHADEVAAALVSEDVGEKFMQPPDYYRSFCLPDETPRGIDRREKAFSKFLRGNWQSIIDARLAYESAIPADNKTEKVREFLITLMGHNFLFYLKDGAGVGIDFVPVMLGLNDFGSPELRDDAYLHQSQKTFDDILEEHSHSLSHPLFESPDLDGSQGYANFGCNVVGQSTLEFFPYVGGNAFSKHPEAKQIEAEIQRFMDRLKIDGSVSLKKGFHFNVIWQRKLPEEFHDLEFHQKGTFMRYREMDDREVKSIRRTRSVSRVPSAMVVQKPLKVRLSVNTGTEVHALDVKEEYWEGVQSGMQGFTSLAQLGLWDGKSEDVTWIFNAMGPSTLLVVGEDREILSGTLADIDVASISN